ncbi:MAG: TetR/AcrR family transcriptional regulator [Actinobacteria bacterium]|nr:TetR/AcrR family transcriptional regulator [Actinomycetota bacterium]NCU86843.1 TetR/AcrR family transcriptional regulator [Actinomycetota bacterium]
MAPKAIEQTLREKVIKAAVKYVADNGPDGLSFRQIAADAGVSHQAPYHHFGDRSAIFGEIALEGFRKFAVVMGAPARADEDTENCVRLCERYVDFAIANKGHFRVMFRADLCQMHESPETQKAADDAFATLLEAVSEMVGDSASIDEIRVQATAMWSLAHGLATLIIDGPLEKKIGRVSDRRALVRSVAQRAADGLRRA